MESTTCLWWVIRSIWGFVGRDKRYIWTYSTSLLKLNKYIILIWIQDQTDPFTAVISAFKFSPYMKILYVHGLDLAECDPCLSVPSLRLTYSCRENGHLLGVTFPNNDIKAGQRGPRGLWVLLDPIHPATICTLIEPLSFVTETAQTNHNTNLYVRCRDEKSLVCI